MQMVRGTVGERPEAVWRAQVRWMIVLTCLVWIVHLATGCSTANTGTAAAPVKDDPGSNDPVPAISTVEPATARNSESVTVTCTGVGTTVVPVVTHLDRELGVQAVETGVYSVEMPVWFTGGDVSFSFPDGTQLTTEIGWRGDAALDTLRPDLVAMLPEYAVPGESILITGTNLDHGDTLPVVLMDYQPVQAELIDEGWLYVAVPEDLVAEEPVIHVINGAGPCASPVSINTDPTKVVQPDMEIQAGALPAAPVHLLARGWQLVEGQMLLWGITPVTWEQVGAVEDLGLALYDLDLSALEPGSARLLGYTQSALQDLGTLEIHDADTLPVPRITTPEPGGELYGGCINMINIANLPEEQDDVSVSVQIGEVDCDLVYHGVEVISVRLPDEAPLGSQLLTVRTSTGDDYQFVEVLAPAGEPVITSITPQPVRVGEVVTLQGANLTSTTPIRYVKSVELNGGPWGYEPDLHGALVEAGLEYDQRWLVSSAPDEIRLLVPGGAVSGSGSISLWEDGDPVAHVLDFDLEVVNPLRSMVLPVPAETEIGGNVAWHAGPDGELLKVFATTDSGVSTIAVDMVTADFSTRSEVTRHQLYDGEFPHLSSILMHAAFKDDGGLAVIWNGSDLDRFRKYCYVSVYDAGEWTDYLLAEVEWEVTDKGQPTLGNNRVISVDGSGYLVCVTTNPLSTSPDVAEFVLGRLTTAGGLTRTVLFDAGESPIFEFANVTFVSAPVADLVYMLQIGDVLGQGSGITLFGIDPAGELTATVLGFKPLDSPPSTIPISPWRIWLSAADDLTTIPISTQGFGTPREDPLPDSALSLGYASANPYPYMPRLLTTGDQADVLLLEGSYSVKDEYDCTIPASSNLSASSPGFNRSYYLARITAEETSVEFLGSGLGVVSNVIDGDVRAYVLTKQTPSPELQSYSANLGIVARILTN